MRLIIHGEIVPYVRVGRERWTDRARRYFASKDAIQIQARSQMAARGYEMLPGQTPFKMTIRFARRKLWTCDTDNLFKAVADALQGIAYPDDRWMSVIGGSKGGTGGGEDLAIIEIEEVGK